MYSTVYVIAIFIKPGDLIGSLLEYFDSAFEVSRNASSFEMQEY